MTERNFSGNPIYNMPSMETEEFRTLAELALNLRWCWNRAADTVWRQLNPQLWGETRSPWLVLQTVSREKLRTLLANPEFSTQVNALLQTQKSMAEAPAWFTQQYPNAPLSCVAYFSMEFMLSEALPIYSGGLGNVAGDQLKSASDLGVPVVGVGLLYQQGYFRQIIDRYGNQEALYPYNDPGQLPITPLRKSDGEWLRLEIALPGYSMWLRTWQVQIGRRKLYLLDSNDPANFPIHRGITSELYGGGPELRLKQELLLGIGGWRLLEALGLNPEVCHLNEGHAAFAVLERARSFMNKTGLPFDAALEVTRAGNLFTTHTAVAAGFDRFAPALISQYLGRYAQEKLGISHHDLFALGRRNPADNNEPFNMAYLAMRGCGAVNAVSRLHGQVSRDLFAMLYPRWPVAEVPVTYVTNGVHAPSWESAAADAVWAGTCGTGRWLGNTETLAEKIDNIPDATLWELRTTSRTRLVEHTRIRLSRQLAGAGTVGEVVEAAKHLLAPNVLTLGFARRFATYKRPNLLLHDQERLIRLLTNPQRPVQLIIAGKAHPADGAGQQLIQQWIRFVQRPEVRPHVVFLGDYDMRLAQRLVRGVDVWINTPRRPWEASGTSGMKVLVNGGLNLSELDGWWAEAYAPDVGWALGDGKEHGDDPGWDAYEANQLYDLLEKEVIPEFYSRDANGIPIAWVKRMRASMSRLTPQFCTNRTVREYTQLYYLPAATNYLARAADNGAVGQKIVKWKRTLEAKWAAVRFGEIRISTNDAAHTFDAQVYLNELEPGMVRLELFANGLDGGAPVRQEMIFVRKLTGATGGYAYSAQVPATRPAADYTPRIIPQFVGVAVPLEADQIVWQR
ncbi:MAG: alpha-glucan family phosphorylase [Phycisphaerae bacterium]